jgi:hypothetical protein
MALPDQIDPRNRHAAAPDAESGAEESSGRIEIDREAFPVGKGPSVSVGDLRSRVEAAFFQGERPRSAAASQAAPLTLEDQEPERWSPRIQFAVIFGGSALGWALILTPFLVF